jgi:hypothetical protein
VRSHELRCAVDVSRLPPEAVLLPVPTVHAGLDHDLRTNRRHRSEQAVAVERIERVDPLQERLPPAEDIAIPGVEQPADEAVDSPRRFRTHELANEAHAAEQDRDGGQRGGRHAKPSIVSFHVPRTEPLGERPREEAVVEQGHTECNGQQVEEAVVARRRDRTLERQLCEARRNPQPAWAEEEERRYDLDHEHQQYGELVDPRRELVGVPPGPDRQTGREVVVVERGELPPARIETDQLHQAGEHHQLEQQGPE